MTPVAKNVLEEAIDVLNKDGSGCKTEDLVNLAKALKNKNVFSHARRILAIVRKKDTGSQALWIDQQLALCTYKDVDLPVDDRLEDALTILKDGIAQLEKSNDSETLGLAGAIYKRKWENNGQQNQLELARHYYNKAWQLKGLADDGYTAINTAYVLDLLANQLKLNVRDNTLDERSVQYSNESRDIRNAIVAGLEKKVRGLCSTEAEAIRRQREKLITDKEANELKPNWWQFATLAEAYFGLGMFDKSEYWLTRGLIEEQPDGSNVKRDVDDWELESTCRQLAQIALLHKTIDQDSPEESNAWKALKVLFKTETEATAALTTTFVGKVGLALSGGGHRAALYHIGVLARLAEADLLRRVEVLSCVSGGSILGAYYYLKVRNLFREKPDVKITGDDYIKIVREIYTDFLTGVQRNIRMRVFSNWWSTVKIFFARHYSRTNRLGELYEKIFYQKIFKKNIFMHELRIEPLGASNPQSFSPKYDNWRRQAKVPILILNATSLNTGHNWQFTASFMGEPPSTIEKIDGNYRMRRMYYKTDGDKEVQRKVRLGHAVAASSCVPGMFSPLSLSKLYPEKVVRLVDGGVHDNQGITGLTEQDCNVILVSDASGQMGSKDSPPKGIFSVLPRANDILMERVRNAQFKDLEGRYRQGRLKGFMFVHLKMGLDVQLIDWLNCEDPKQSDTSAKTIPVTGYNIRKEVQRQIAAIRTDLDSFHETEAHALMTSGYKMTDEQLSKFIHLPKSAIATYRWPFLEIEQDLQRSDTPKKVSRLLNVSSKRMGKIWKLNFLAAAIVALLWSIIAYLIFRIAEPIVTQFQGIILWLGIGFAILSMLWIISRVHVTLFDWLYLEVGKRPKREMRN